MLDYKIKELKLQIAPRETEIATMRQQIDEMTLELEQYNKSNLALNLMIEELKLKLEGVKTEYSQQCERNNLNIALMEKIRRDLQDLWAARDDQNHFKNWMVKVYRIYAQEDFSPGSIAGGSSKKGDADDPQQLYNRDREQMERSLDSLRRAIKSEAMAHKRDIGKMMREGVLLTKEYNTLKKNYRSLYMQKKAIDSVGPIGPNNDLTQVMDLLGLNSKKNNRAVAKPVKDVALSSSTQPVPPIPRINSGSGKAKPRSAALRTITADGIVDPTQTTLSRQDKWEAWREIQMQYDQMRVLEEQLTALCHTLEIDPMQVIYGIDSHLLNI